MDLKVSEIGNPHPNTKLYCRLRHVGSQWDTVGFTLEEFPGCCGVLISNTAWIANSKRGMGLGTIMNNLRIGLARWFGYGCLMCTSDRANLIQNRILDKNDWKLIDVFKNPHTGHIIEIWKFNL